MRSGFTRSRCVLEKKMLKKRNKKADGAKKKWERKKNKKRGTKKNKKKSLPHKEHKGVLVSWRQCLYPILHYDSEFGSETKEEKRRQRKKEGVLSNTPNTILNLDPNKRGKTRTKQTPHTKNKKKRNKKGEKEILSHKKDKRLQSWRQKKRKEEKQEKRKKEKESKRKKEKKKKGNSYPTRNTSGFNCLEDKVFIQYSRYDSEFGSDKLKTIIVVADERKNWCVVK